MIRDYKFNSKLSDRAARRHGRLGIYLASSVLAGVLVTLGLPDTEATSPAAGPAHPQPLAHANHMTVEEPLRISAPLAPPEPVMQKVSLLQAVQPPPLPVPEQAPTAPEPEVHTAVVPAVQPEPTEATATAVPAPAEPAPATHGAERPDAWKTHRIARGETLAGIFKTYGLSASTLYRVLHAGKDAKTLAHIRPGQKLRFRIDQQGGLGQLVFVRNPIESLRVTRTDDGFSVRLDSKQIERKINSVAGTIESSLFVDGQKAGLSDSQIMELAEIFGWDIDFALEIRAGDQFRVIYEEQFVDGRKYRNGPIIAAEFVNRGKTYQAFRYETRDGISYYDAGGHSKRRAFIRTPIRFARISSRFQPHRWHPVLKKWKSHKGVDYAAPKGTSIKVTGNGRVIFRGWQRGYGRVVIVQHSSKYRTVYAHMSRFRGSVKKGSRVKQGQVIGYVGQSGWATGPHLHYEFRVNNVQRNPLTVKLPKSLPLPKRQLAAFKRKIAPLTQQLTSIRQATMVASADR